MSIDGWKYYNYAAIPTTAPHEEPNLKSLTKRGFWTGVGKSTLLARWQTDWDCGYETPWWYCIKDAPLDLTSLKSKRRYEINKGNKNYQVHRIDPSIMKDDLYKVSVNAYMAWPEKYRPKIDRESFGKQIESWRNADFFGGFDIETGEICGFAVLMDYGSFVEFSVLRTDPEAEKKAINAAIIAHIIEYYEDRFDGKFYINDGSRAIRHETAFQDYLEKYFGFRKAYCKLNVKYRPGFGLLVKALYPFRNQMKNDSTLGSSVSAILKMEEIARSFRRKI